MEKRIYFVRCFLMIITFVSLISGERSTIERIRKHQEWLQQRNKESPLSNSRNSFESAKYWKFNRDSWAKTPPPDTRSNDVYPENDIVLSTTTVASSSIASNIPEAAPTTTTMATGTSSQSAWTTTTTTTTTQIPTTEITTNLGSGQNALVNFPMATFTSTSESSIPTVVRKPKFRSYPRWGNWSNWSECSRPCGGGVISQERKCISKRSSTGKRFVSNECVGLYRRYHLCNEQACPPTDIDFREQQCSNYNDVEFQGRKYIWVPYIKDDAECELNCKPIGDFKYFATLNNSVIDGTTCHRPAEYYRANYRDRAICVSGICKAIHSSGMITGLSANSGSVSCGGLICRAITGIFTRNPLPEDAYIHVATIPAGASNITITELKNSINLLVLRTSDQKYIFNGDNTDSASGIYKAAGAVFDYRRIDGLQHGDGVTEWITCTGPIRELLELMVYSKDMNPGIKYEYLLPISSESEESDLSLESDGFLKTGADENSVNTSAGRPLKRRKFNWKVVGFTPCSKSCGGGMQAPIVRCVRENPTRYFSQRRCAHAEKPVLNENLLRCNTQPCPAYWRIDEWGECRCHQNGAGGNGHRSREIDCVQELASGIVIQVKESACLEEMPTSKKPCECPKSARRRIHRYHGQSNGRLQTSAVFGNSSVAHHIQRMKEKAGIWLMSDWNQYCPVECGSGIEHRSIFCDRSKPHIERCDLRMTPDITRPCEKDKECEMGEWFIGPWSPCNGNCFNLTKTRNILCINKLLIVEDEECDISNQPATLEKCSHTDVEYCGPRWHYSVWTQCTKPCNGGTQRRSVKCLEYDQQENILRESTKCRYSRREPIYRSCNTHKCDDAPPDNIQNDIAQTCIDELPNCHLAVKAKLCVYDFYRESCCYSCGLDEA